MNETEQREFIGKCERAVELLSGTPPADCVEVNYLVKPRSRKAERYEARTFIVQESAQAEMGRDFISGISSRCCTKDGDCRAVRWYDVEPEDGCVFALPAREVPAFETVESSVTDQPSAQDAKSIMLKSTIQRCEMVVPGIGTIRSYSHIQSMKTLESKRRVFRADGDRVVGRDQDALQVFFVPDAIAFDGALIVFNRDAFEFIFSYKEALESFVEERKADLERIGVIGNSGAFVDACKGSDRRMRALKRMILEERFAEVAQYRDSFEDVADLYQLNVHVENGTIEFRGGGSGEIDDIINLVSHYCVTDALSGNRMLASDIANRNVGQGGA